LCVEKETSQKKQQTVQAVWSMPIPFLQDVICAVSGFIANSLHGPTLQLRLFTRIFSAENWQKKIIFNPGRKKKNDIFILKIVYAWLPSPPLLFHWEINKSKKLFYSLLVGDRTH